MFEIQATILGVSEDTFLNEKKENQAFYKLAFRVGKGMPVTVKCSEKGYVAHKENFNKTVTVQLKVDGNSVIKAVG